MTMRMTLPDAQTRDAMLTTGMEGGMEASYVRLEGMISASFTIALQERISMRSLIPLILNIAHPISLKVTEQTNQ